MENQQYSFESASAFTAFEFVSKGKKGHIIKIVKYTEYGDSGMYNLGFGDKIGDSDKFDDKAISDNGDREKILATVAATIYEFINEYPNASIYAKGSNLARTRLYRIAISSVLDEINKDFTVLGYLEENWEKFERNQNYSAFLIIKK